jgi:nucleoside-diphosphate-sugar epimerase
MELRDKVVFVTGANGFVGTHVCRRLADEGMRVRALVRSPEAAAELQRMGVGARVGELTDEGAQAAVVRGAFAVVHTAATPAEDMAEARRVNVEATAMLVEAAIAAGCERFVHISTVSVYPLRERSGEVDEGSPMVTSGDAYSVSKAEADKVASAAADRGLFTVILRPAVILGVHPRSFWGTIFPKLIAEGKFAHVDEGRTRLGYLHVSSLVDAVVASLRTEDERVKGQAFNIVDGHAEWRRYTQPFIQSPLPSLSPDQLPGFLSFRGSFSNEKAQRLLGFAPRDIFDSSLEEIVRASPKA